VGAPPIAATATCAWWGQQRRAGEVADREQGGLARAAGGVGLDEAGRVEGHGGGVEAKQIAVRPPPRGDEDAVHLHRRRPRAGQNHLQATGHLPDRSDARRRVERPKLAAAGARQGRDQLPLHPREELSLLLHQDHPAAEGGVGPAKFQPHGARPHHQQARPDLLQGQGRLRVHRPGGAGEGRRRGRTGAGGEDGVVKADSLFPSRTGDHRLVSGEEARRTHQPADVAGLGEGGKAARHPPHHPLLPGAQAVEVDRRLPKLDPHAPRPTPLLHHLGGGEQRLRRDAPLVQADAAGQGPEIDEDHLHPAIGGGEGGGVAARPPPDDQQLRLHARSPHPSLGQP